MTRPINTPEEKIAGSELLSHLVAIGRSVTPIEREIPDRPDLCFLLDQFRVGCECVQVPPTRVFKYLHTRFKQLEKSDAAAVRIIWPQEQHFWIKEAIESKSKKIGAYKKNCDAEKVWLLIHDPLEQNMNLVRSENDEIMNLIKYSANRYSHGFDEVYFYSKFSGVTKIFPVSDAWASVNFNFSDGYPTSGFVQGRGKFTTTAHGAEPRTYDYGIVTPEIIVVPPQDPEFRKHRPSYKPQNYRFTIVTGATSAEAKFDPVEE